jgi:SPP1 gp7 family putative phage head morphogenesis protein
VAEVQTAVTNLQAPQRVKDALQRALIDGVDLGVSVAVDQLGSVGFDYTLAHAEARQAATQYSYELIRGIEESTQRVMRESVSRWVENGEPLERLVKDLEPTFGRQRARVIAQTETTRAYQMGAQESYRQSGVVEEVEWQTAADELVCPTCGPKQGQRMPLGSSDVPPAHPNCRCWIAPVVKDANDA